MSFINEMLREARAEGLGIFAPPSELFCTTCQKRVEVVAFVLTAPDELSCGHIYLDRELFRCGHCGWPHAHDHEHAALIGAVNYCGDGIVGCRELRDDWHNERCKERA